MYNNCSCYCVCVCGLCLSQKTVQKRSSSFAKTTVFPDHHEEPILLKVEILFLLLVKPLKTNSKIELGPRADRNSPPSNRVRSEFRRGQTPKQLDSAATAVMTLAVAATTAAAL